MVISQQAINAARKVFDNLIDFDFPFLNIF